MNTYKITYKNPNRKPYGWKEPTAKDYKRLYRQNPKEWQDLGRSMAGVYQAYLESLEVEELKDYIKTLAERLGEETDPKKKKALREEAERALQHVKATRPKEYAQAVDPATNNFFNNKVTNTLKEYNAGNGATVLLKIDYKDLPHVHGVERLTDYDRLILNAVNSLIHAGNNFVTVEQVYKVLKSYKQQTKATKAIKEKIKKSIRTLTTAQITINNNDQHIKHKTSLFKYRAAFLVAEELGFYLNGQKVEGWFIHRSGLYEYAKATNKILITPLERLAVPLSVNALDLRDYMLGRVHQAKTPTKRKNQQTNIVKYSTLEERFNPSKDRKKRERLKKNIKTILNSFKHEKIINDWRISEKPDLRYILDV